jgi:AraC family transcriptional regulator
MKISTRDDYIDRIRRVLRFVQDHLDEPLAPERLASVAHFSRFHFHRVFSGLVGESLGAHVRRLRLERAAGELRWTDRPVIDIALDAGYEAPEPFTRAFRAHFGEAPSQFRTRRDPLSFPPAACRVHFGIDDAIARFAVPQEPSIMIDIRIETQPTRRLLAIEHRGHYMAIGDVFARLSAIAFGQGLAAPGAVSIGLYYDDPDVVPTAQLRSHACIAVRDHVTTAPDGCEFVTLEGGDTAVATHRGPYARLAESYRELYSQWLPASGREAAHRPCHEVYVSDATVTPEGDLITEICLPLVPEAAAVGMGRG